MNSQAQNSTQTYVLKREIRELEHEKKELKSNSIRLRNGLNVFFGNYTQMANVVFRKR